MPINWLEYSEPLLLLTSLSATRSEGYLNAIAPEIIVKDYLIAELSFVPFENHRIVDGRRQTKSRLS